jgi:glycosyltransferase involved in cell wall biosynthesis
MIDFPLVSILMTSFNKERFISAAIESVLASTYNNLELIVVDDCSNDSTVEIVKQYLVKDRRIRLYVNERNLGDYPNRNKAATYANGKYIKYLDADDLIYYYGLEVIVNYMEKFPDAGFGLASPVSDHVPFPIQLTPREAYLEHFGAFGHFDRSPGSSIIKLDVFNKVGGFSGKRMIGDYEFWFKIARYYNMVKYPFDLYWNRIHSEQESKTPYAKNYPELRRSVLFEALENPDCPLNSEDFEFVNKSIKEREGRNVFVSLFGKLIQKVNRRL